LSIQEIREINEHVEEVEETKEQNADSQEEGTHLESNKEELLILTRILHTYESSLDKDRDMIFHS